MSMKLNLMDALILFLLTKIAWNTSNSLKSMTSYGAICTSHSSLRGRLPLNRYSMVWFQVLFLITAFLLSPLPRRVTVCTFLAENSMTLSSQTSSGGRFLQQMVMMRVQRKSAVSSWMLMFSTSMKTTRKQVGRKYTSSSLEISTLLEQSLERATERRLSKEESCGQGSYMVPITNRQKRQFIEPHCVIFDHWLHPSLLGLISADAPIICMLRSVLGLRSSFALFRASDPYYILGVDKRADFPEVKKKFYEYANIYHPDKNPSPEASDEFMLIKDAFEQIKAERGLSISQNIYRSSTEHEEESIRPNASQYTGRSEEADANFSSSTDYKLYAEKIPDGDLYDRFRQSFSTIDNIDDLKIKVERGEMKDNMKRLGLENARVKIRLLTDGGSLSLMIMVASIGVAVLLGNKAMNWMEDKKHLQASTMLRKPQGNFIRGNDNYSSSEVEYLRKDQDYVIFKRQQKTTDNDVKFLSQSEKVFNYRDQKTW